MADEKAWKASFENHRDRLWAVAHRMLGSRAEADDAVQEAWLRLHGATPDAVENPAGWLTTVVSRICLDMLRARQRRDVRPEIETRALAVDTRADAELADAIGPALLVVLETLTPTERVAFVLHDVFDLTFEEIARILDRAPAAARQLASRARRRVQEGPSAIEADLPRQRRVVDAFLTASREGRFDALLAVLTPDATMRADEPAVRASAANNWGQTVPLERDVRGADSVARALRGRGRGAHPAVIDGQAGAVWATGEQVHAVFLFAVEDERISSIELVMDRTRIAQLEIALGP